MSTTNQGFEEFRFDFISHLADRFGIPADVVRARLGEWLLDRTHDDEGWKLELARR